MTWLARLAHFAAGLIVGVIVGVIGTWVWIIWQIEHGGPW